MTGSQRSALRAMVNAERRRRLELAERSEGAIYCSGCGGRLSNWTWDCHTCRERFRGLRRRGAISEREWSELSQIAAAHVKQERERAGNEGGHPRDFWHLYPDRLAAC